MGGWAGCPGGGRQAALPPGLAVREGAGLVLGTSSLSPWLLLCGFWPPGAWSSQSCKSWAARVGLQRGGGGDKGPRGAWGRGRTAGCAWSLARPVFHRNTKVREVPLVTGVEALPRGPRGEVGVPEGGTRGQQGHPGPQGLGPELTMGAQGRDVGRPLPGHGAQTIPTRPVPPQPKMDLLSRVC